MDRLLMVALGSPGGLNRCVAMCTVLFACVPGSARLVPLGFCAPSWACFQWNRQLL